MSAQNTQIRVTLPIQLEELLHAKASRFGLGLAAYIKHLVIADVKDVKDIKYPEFEASDRTIQAFHDAMKARKEGKMIKVKDVDTYLDSL